MLLILAFSTAFLVDETLAILRSRLAVEALDWPRRSVKHNAEVTIPFPEWPERPLCELLDAPRSISRSF